MHPTDRPSDEAPTPGEHFPVVGALPPALLAGLTLAVVVETVGVHLWLAPRHPLLSWTLVVLGALSIGWFVLAQRVTAWRPIVLDGRTLVLRTGLRLDARLDVADDVAGAVRPTWRTQPPPARDYLNAAAPGEPNVVVTLRRPTAVRTTLGTRRTVARIGVAVRDPDRLVALLSQRVVATGSTDS